MTREPGVSISGWQHKEENEAAHTRTTNHVISADARKVWHAARGNLSGSRLMTSSAAKAETTAKDKQGPALHQQPLHGAE